LVAPFTRLDRLEYVLVITGYEGGLPEQSPRPGASSLPSPSAP
jgi:hypothetical protein